MKKCSYCDEEIKVGEEYLQVGDDEDGIYCKDCYEEHSYTYYEAGGEQVGDENDSEIKTHSPYKCEECDKAIGVNNVSIYKINDKTLCNYCAMEELGYEYFYDRKKGFDVYWEHKETNEIVSFTNYISGRFLKNHEVKEEDLDEKIMR